MKFWHDLSPAARGWLTGLGILFAAGVLRGILFDTTPVCSDGWASPSIGRSGACSHHGGVVHPGFWLMVIGGVLGIYYGIKVGIRKDTRPRRTPPPRAASKPPAPSHAAADTVIISSPEPDAPRSRNVPIKDPICPLHGKMVDKGNRWICPTGESCHYFHYK